MKRYKIIKATDCNLIGVIFEYVIIDGMQPPKWFTEWNVKFEKHINSRFDKIEFDIADIKLRLTNVENRLETVIKLNNLKTK